LFDEVKFKCEGLLVKAPRCAGSSINSWRLYTLGAFGKAVPPIVLSLDSDSSSRHSLKALVQSIGLRFEGFSSAEEFLSWKPKDSPSCLILEVRLPGISGLDLQGRLAKANVPIPLIFLTAYGDVSMSVRAMKAGAVDFLNKPFREQDVLDAIQLALERDRDRRRRESGLGALRQKYESLTPRERQVVEMVVAGNPNKLVAGQIGVRENTVKVHRHRAMAKMQAQSLPELVRMVEYLFGRRALPSSDQEESA
jgi:FixJ family two-component response regulator